MKKFIFSVLSLAFALTVSACGNPEQPWTTEAGKQNQEPVTLRVAWWGGQSRHDYTLKVIDMYEKENPHVKIEAEYANWDDYWKQMAPLAAGSRLPDVFQTDLLYLTPYGEKGLLEDLTPYVEDGLINVGSISENARSGGMIGDKLFGFNLGVNAPAVVIDGEMLKKAGIQPPNPDWAWADFEQLAVQVKQKMGIYGTNGMKPPEVFFPYFLRTKGQHLYSSDGTSLGYSDDSLFVDYFGRQLRLLEVGAFPNPGVTAQIKGFEDELIVKGETPIQWIWSNQYLSLAKAAGRPLELYMPPGPGLKEGMFLKPSMFFSISKSSKQKEEAAKFINYFVNNIEANKLIKGDRGVPVSAEVVEALKPELTPEQAKIYDYVTQVSQNSSTMDPPDPIGVAEVVKALLETSDEILFKRITPEEGAAKFRKRANEILAQNKK